MKNGLIALIFCGLICCLSGCEKPLAPDFESIENVNVTLNGLKSMNLSCDANFYNPNEKKIVLKTVNININVDGKYLTSIEKDYDLDLTPKARFTIPVEANIKLKDIGLSDALAFMKNSVGEKAFNFKGKIKVKMYGMNFNIPIDHNEVVRLN